MRLKINPPGNTVRKETEDLRDAISGMLSHVKINDLLMGVYRWTSFTRHFTYPMTGEPVKNAVLLLTAILTDVTSPARLSWLTLGIFAMRLTQ